MSERTVLTFVAPVAEVTLFEDRAQPSRRGQLQLEAGSYRLVVEGLAPILSDRSLRVELARASQQGTRIQDFRVRRELKTSERQLPEALRALKVEERKRREALGFLQKRKERREGELEQVSEVATQLMQEAAEDVGWGNASPERWRAELEQLQRLQGEIHAEIRDLIYGHEDAERELRDLQRRIRAGQGWDSVLHCQVEVDLEVDEAGVIELELAYIVPAACWRPRYRAVLATRPSPRLTIERHASVWQHTGEAWDGVTLHFSTQRPSLGTEPPLLDEDELRVRQRQEQVVVETREQAVHTTGLGQNRQQAQELPGVDDGGEPVNLRAAHPATIPSDGRPYRVSIGESEAEATIERVVMAERHPAVLLRCTAHNTAEGPLLAGPVDLVADAGRIGRGQLGFVAPGEKLELGFGPDPDLRVFRRTERVEREPGMLSRWHETAHRVEIKLSNLAADPRRVKVIERVPVSEIDQVEIHVDGKETTAAASPDKDGFLGWDRELGSDATDTVELAYTVRKRSDVVER